MTVIVCVDVCNGMLFHNRRVSADRVVIEKILALAGDAPIFMRPYSAGLFPEGANIVLSDDYLKIAAPGQICFAESEDLALYLGKARRVILFQWNRQYPSDVKFPVHLLKDSWKLASVTNFSGHSHDQITQEVYVV